MMPLNKTKGNMYPFITHTWNPIKGKCPHACAYCYMERIWHKTGRPAPKPRLVESELRTNFGNGNYIFVGSSIDLFAPEIPIRWLNRIELHTASYPNNTYLWHTKNPNMAVDFLPVRENYILCTTIETDRFYGSCMGNSPVPMLRASHLIEKHSKYKLFRKMVTIEPIMDFGINSFVRIISDINPEQVNIGADTGNNHLPEPPAEKVLELIAELEKFTTVYQKKNLGRLLAGGSKA